MNKGYSFRKDMSNWLLAGFAFLCALVGAIFA